MFHVSEKLRFLEYGFFTICLRAVFLHKRLGSNWLKSPIIITPARQYLAKILSSEIIRQSYNSLMSAEDRWYTTPTMMQENSRGRRNGQAFMVCATHVRK